MKSITIHNRKELLSRALGLDKKRKNMRTIRTFAAYGPRRRKRGFTSESRIWKRLYDIWIAAQGLEHASSVLTLDDHFNHIANLKVWRPDS